jgi:hypothetical protein
MFWEVYQIKGRFYFALMTGRRILVNRKMATTVS